MVTLYAVLTLQNSNLLSTADMFSNLLSMVSALPFTPHPLSCVSLLPLLSLQAVPAGSEAANPSFALK